MPYFFKKDVLIRKEHFGSLILMLDGRRFLLPPQYFKLLKNLNGKTESEIFKITDLKKNKVKNIISDLKDKGVISSRPNKVFKIIENDFVSKDCLSYPRTVYWECTQNCNFRCIHCYSSSGGQSFKEMPLEAAYKMIDEMSQKGVEFLCIGGGEPLTYKHIYKVLKRCNERGLMVEMTTNGSLVKPEVIKKLKASGLRFLQVSIDGATAQTYKKIRINGDLDKVLKNIHNLSKDFTLSICSVAMKYNIKEIGDLIDLAKKIGARYYRVLPLMPVGRATDKDTLAISKKELKELNEYILKRKKFEKDIFIQLNENLIVPDQKNIEWMPEEHYGCSAARSTCGIDALGNVFPCSYMRSKELTCGNVTKSSLAEIWSNSKVMIELRNMGKPVGRCRKCSYLDKCRGGCRAAAYLKNGKINGSDPLCTIK